MEDSIGQNILQVPFILKIDEILCSLCMTRISLGFKGYTNFWVHCGGKFNGE